MYLSFIIMVDAAWMAGLRHVPGSSGRELAERPLAAPQSPQGPTGRDSPTPTAGGPFSFRRAVPIFAACAMPWSVIKQSGVRSAAGRRSSDFGHFVLAGAPILTSAVGSPAAMRLRPTRGTGLTLPSPRTTDRWVVVDSRVKNGQPQGITGPYALFARHQGSSLAHSGSPLRLSETTVVGFRLIGCPNQRRFVGSPLLCAPRALTGQSLFLSL